MVSYSSSVTSSASDSMRALTISARMRSISARSARNARCTSSVEPATAEYFSAGICVLDLFGFGSMLTVKVLARKGNDVWLFRSVEGWEFAVVARNPVDPSR
jgi:hypothetical protein